MKRLFKFLLILIVLLPTIALAESINLYSKAYVVYDTKDDKVILSKNTNKKYSIASLTKIMTILVALDNIEDVNQKVVVKQSDLLAVPSDAAKIGLKVNEEISYHDLILETLMVSTGDSATVLAINSAGSLSNFVNQMNTKATKIGLKSTHFSEVIGVDDNNNYSTIDDLLILLKYAMNNEEFATYFKTRSAITEGGKELSATYITFSEKVGIETPRLVAAKTGYTDVAGLCMAYVFNKFDRYYYAITLGAPVEKLKNFKNIQDANTVLKYMDDNYEYKLLLSTDDVYSTIKIKNSDKEEYNITVREDVYALFENTYDKNKIISKTDLPKELSPKNKKGDKLGTITYYYNNSIIATEDVYLEEDINFSLMGFIKSNKTLSLAIGLGIIVLLSIIAMIIIKKTKE